jgi:hypothetical protein
VCPAEGFFRHARDAHARAGGVNPQASRRSTTTQWEHSSMLCQAVRGQPARVQAVPGCARTAGPRRGPVAAPSPPSCERITSSEGLPRPKELVRPKGLPRLNVLFRLKGYSA